MSGHSVLRTYRCGVIIRPKTYQVWIIKHVLMQESFKLPLDAFGFSHAHRLPYVEAVEW